MSLISRVTTWVTNQILTSSALNAEFNNITNLINNLDAATTTWTNVKATNVTVASGTVTGILGRVLQVVTGTTSTNVTRTAATYLDTGLTANITPSFTNSKILILVSQAAFATHPSTCQIKLTGTTTGTISTNMGLYCNTSAGLIVGTQVGIVVVDSPGTVTTQTYKTQFASKDGTNTVGVNGDGTLGYNNYIVLVEIGQT